MCLLFKKLEDILFKKLEDISDEEIKKKVYVCIRQLF
jgi:hypothetical protein